ncbi:ATP-binding protein [Lyngbya confervoides]|uniref:Circadian input-output histidine kinase CikA n=1 Tax=Lyngbya confervoides BDU141951 TaxID=1574623 RepID=A0ABD4T4H1_9CYAN|nr:ATP-binding protein [Lyngbya confervoides]MCM1983583.1 ATP-binding protein [Lyngbya confervoides BDU141951]
MRITTKFLGSSLLLGALVLGLFGGGRLVLHWADQSVRASQAQTQDSLDAALRLDHALRGEILALKDYVLLTQDRADFVQYDRSQREFVQSLQSLQVLMGDVEELVRVEQRHRSLTDLARRLSPTDLTLEQVRREVRAINDLSDSMHQDSSLLIQWAKQQDQQAKAQFMAIQRHIQLAELLLLGGVALTLILQFYTILRPMMRSVKVLQAGAVRFGAGHLDHRLQIRTDDELADLAHQFNTMAEQLQRTQQHLQEKIRELKVAREISHAANLAKSQFLSNMSHELRTPLNGILGYAQILERSPNLGEREKKGIQVIHSCGHHLLTLISDILDLAKIEARKLDLLPTPVVLTDVIQEIVELFQVRAAQKQIRFEPIVQLGALTQVVVDAKRLRQVLLNLLGNALKFTDAGGITFRVESLEETIQGSAPGSLCTLRFAVEDTGVGIAPEDLPRLFQSFEQVGDRSRQDQGTGLGLVISQKIVEMMGGQIQVQSLPGQGSIFSFEVCLPRLLSTSAPTAIASAHPAHIVGYEGKTRHILVIDDCRENRVIFQDWLESLGFHVTMAENGPEGLAEIQRQPPDLVILDLAMPVMDGLVCLKQIRQDPKLQDLKILVSSASVSEVDQQRSLAAGGDDFLPKPISSHDLCRQLKQQLKLTWRYAAGDRFSSACDQVIGQGIGEMPSDDPLSLPPVAELQQMLQISQEGRLKCLTQMAQTIGVEQPHCQPFTKVLMRLAEAFEVEALEALLQDSLQRSGAQATRDGSAHPSLNGAIGLAKIP